MPERTHAKRTDAKVGATKARATEVGATKAGATEVGATEVRATDTGAGGGARIQPGGSCRPHPGDVSRRIALLREELGLSREELAQRAGMAPSFVQYVEEQPDTISTGTLLRLAAALRTTTGQLLGAESGPPPVLHELGAQECWDRLAEHAFGRVAVSAPDGPLVIPVAYTVDGRAIVCHVCPGAGVSDPPPGTEVAFEIDQVDEVLGSGWSVLVSGTVDRPAGGPGPGGEQRVRVVPERVSGRVIRAD